MSVPAASPRPDEPLRAPSDRTLLLVVAVAAAAGILPYALVHLDDVDGAVYSVIARHLAEDGTPLHLRFLPARWPSFFEHPPLFFWIQAIAVRLASERSLPWLGGALGIATALVTFDAGRRTVGVRAAFLGAIVLCATDEFMRFQPRPRLEPPLALAYTSAVTLLLAARGRTWLYALGGLVAGLGALVKGPPALGAPVSAALALVALGRGRELRSARAWIVTAAFAALPPALFLAWDAVALGGAWWHGYVQNQVLASLAGRRPEGSSSEWWRPIRVLAGGFWPGLPFVVVGLLTAVARPRSPGARGRLALAAWALVVIVGFATPMRLYWWYMLPAFMPLALLAGGGLETVLDALAPRAWFGVAVRALGLVAIVALAAAPFWPKRLLAVPCKFGDLPARAAALTRAGELVGLVDPASGLGEPAWIAQHSGRDVLDVRRPEDLAARRDVRLALFAGDDLLPAGFEILARHGTWRLAQRVGTPAAAAR